MSLKIQHLVRMKNMGVEGWEDKFESAAKSILEQINILSNTASEFSSFAKFYYEETVEMNLAEVINEQKVFFDTRENIRIIYDYCHKNCIVYARKGQIIRVLVNLISNAIQALEETSRQLSSRWNMPNICPQFFSIANNSWRPNLHNRARCL